jgi:L-malate glycosyltransferase
MAALEAMASEVPVIGSRAGGLPEVVVEDETGYLLPVGDVEGMAARAIEILTHPDLQRRLGRNGRDLAEGKFNVNRVVPKYREFYERVIG